MIPHVVRALAALLLAATSPGVTSPGVTSPGVTSPGVTSAAATSPGAGSAAVTSPGAGSAADRLDALLRERGGTGVAQQLALTGTPRPAGGEIVLTTRVPGAPDRSATTAVQAAAVAADDGRPLPATAQVTRAGEAPARTAVLVVDTSESMSGPGIEAARQAARVYAGTVGADVRVGLVAFDDHPRLLSPATTDRTTLDAGIARLIARGETALYDGLLLATQQAGPHGNVVLLSDGRDTTSTAGLDQALAAVTAGSLQVDVIAFHTAESDQDPLDRIAAAGHGQVVQAGDAADLGSAFAAAAAAVPLDVTVTVRADGGASGRRILVGLVVGHEPYVQAVDLPAPPAPAPPAPAPAGYSGPAVRVTGPPPWLTPWRISGLLLGAGGLIGLVLARPGRSVRGERRRRRLVLEAYGSSSGAVGQERGKAEEEASVAALAAAGVLQVCEQLVESGGRRSAIALRLDRAGLDLAPHEWVALRASIALTVGAMGLLVVHPRGFGLLLGLLVGWAATGIWLRGKQASRCRAFAEELPDTLQTVAGSLRSGFSLQQALAATQETAGEPMASELGRAIAASRIGVILEDELDQIAVRMGSEDWRLAVMAIRIQRSVGGNLSEVLSTTAKTLRERSAVVRQVRALSAEGRLSAYVLLGLPVGVGLFLFSFRRAYLEPLWTTKAGFVMIILGVIGMGFGTVWMFKVAEVEV